MLLRIAIYVKHMGRKSVRSVPEHCRFFLFTIAEEIERIAKLTITSKQIKKKNIAIWLH